MSTSVPPPSPYSSHSQVSDFDGRPSTTGSTGKILLYGCLVIFVGGIFLILCAGFGTYFYIQRQVDAYTAEQPAPIPVAEYSPEELKNLRQRLDKFQKAIEIEEEAADTPLAQDEAVKDDENDEAASSSPVHDDDSVAKSNQPAAPAVELVLTANDLNALIAGEPKLAGKLFVKIEDGQISGDLSVPVGDFLPIGEGRFFNGSGTFDVQLVNDTLDVRLVEATVNGEAIPDQFMEEIRNQNLATDFQNSPNGKKLVKKFSSIEVVEDRVIAKVK